VTLTRTLGRKSSVLVYRNRWTTNYDSDGFGSFHDTSAGVRFTRTLTRDLSLHAG